MFEQAYCYLHGVTVIRNDGLEVWRRLGHTSSFIIPPRRYTRPLPPQGVAVGVAVAVAVGVDVAVDVAVEVGVAVPVAVGGRGVKVDVAGWELCRVIRGLIHRAKSSCEEPLA